MGSPRSCASHLESEISTSSAEDEALMTVENVITRTIEIRAGQWMLGGKIIIVIIIIIVSFYGLQSKPFRYILFLKMF